MIEKCKVAEQLHLAFYGEPAICRTLLVRTPLMFISPFCLWAVWFFSFIGVITVRNMYGQRISFHFDILPWLINSISVKINCWIYLRILFIRRFFLSSVDLYYLKKKINFCFRNFNCVRNYVIVMLLWIMKV